MSLLISDKDTFDVKIRYVIKSGKAKILDEKDAPAPEEKEASFTFKRRLGWKETQMVFSTSISVDGAGNVRTDPYKLIDARLRTLLKDWTVTGDDGKKLPLTSSGIDALDPDLVQYLMDKVNTVLNEE
jgi:hypothetical protein